MALENLPIWSFRPNWANGVLEILEWLTEVMTSPTGGEQRSALRISPRRTFEITVNPWKKDRQYFTNMMNSHSAKYWYVPIWHDVELLLQDYPIGTLEIPMDTSSREFTGSDPAIFLGSSSARDFEAVEIRTVTDTAVVLKTPTTKPWPRGTRMYPGRKAFMSTNNTQNLNYLSDQVSQGAFQFQIAQPNPIPGQGAGWGHLWGLAWGGGGVGPQPWYVQSGWGKTWGYNWGGKSFLPYFTYAGFPVLVERPNVATRLTSGFNRMIQVNDNNVGIPDRRDTAGRSFSLQQYQWQLRKRKSHADFRGLLYYLKGQLVPLWLPTFYEDFRAVASVGADDLTIDVENCGFTLAGGVQPGREYIMIERYNNLPPVCRRLVGSTELGDIERLQFWGKIPGGVQLQDIRRISFIELSRMSSDRVEITHHTDAQGASSCAALFQAAPQIRKTSLII